MAYRENDFEKLARYQKTLEEHRQFKQMYLADAEEYYVRSGNNDNDRDYRQACKEADSHGKKMRRLEELITKAQARIQRQAEAAAEAARPKPRRGIGSY